MSEEMDLKDQIIIGIDLGTTKSGVSIYDPAQQEAVMLKDHGGYEITPSVVSWDRQAQKWLVGRLARELGQRSPGDMIYSIKRYIGRWFTDPRVMYGKADLTYTLISGGHTNQLEDVIVDLGGEPSPLQLSAPQVSAKVLAYLAQAAELHPGLQGKVKYAVVTVPAYFNVMQRRATRLAGKLAGLEVVDILNEPTAAALAYRKALNLNENERRILVFDLGGGTFDISLLEVSQDETGYAFYTKVVDGDTRLGGDDIDIAVAGLLKKQIRDIYHEDVRQEDLVARERLRQAAEQAKVELTEKESVEVDIPALDLGSRPPFDVHLQLSREQLEQCAETVINRARMITRRAVEDVAGLTWDDIDDIILVGGQTLMPAIQRMVKELTGKQPHVKDRPQLAVALGAGEYAHILALGKERFHENTLMNVCALPLGVRVDENTFKVIVPANVSLPHTSRPYQASTKKDQQPIITVEVLQGERGVTAADDCISLGVLEMPVDAAPAGIPKFHIVFELPTDGTLKVTVTDKRSNRQKTQDIFETYHSVVLVNEPDMESPEPAPGSTTSATGG